MKALIIGASGLVGSYLFKACQQRGWDGIGTYHNFPQPNLTFLQLQDVDALKHLLSEHQPEVVFLPAYLSNVDYCELNPDETYQINVVGSLNVANAVKTIGAKLVFYSSDYVFDGKHGAYTEEDIPNPICVYGQQKLEIEQKIASLSDNYLILRITVVYGWESQGKNFISRLVKTLKSNQTIKVPQDQIGSPTLVNDIAEASCRLIEANANGLFHVAGADLIDRYQFALEAAKIFELPTSNIIPVITSDFGQPASRPLNAGMKSDRLTQTINWQLKGTAKGLSFLKSND
ncbi:MAG: SDR family oxidoreductase [Synechococcaceae cyanobacterium RL_1_2]|nr:SDR family oxidoreductase [Synechococcaceae cyanobacterium RL_1_2]